jgi:hypothetical protein
VSIKTAGELRGFLAGILEGIRDGKVDVEEANAIARMTKPKYLRTKKAKGKTYWYFDAGKDAGRQARAHPLPHIKDPSFGGALARAQATRTNRKNRQGVLSLDGLIRMYEKSPEFRGLSYGLADQLLALSGAGQHCSFGTATAIRRRPRRSSGRRSRVARCAFRHAGSRKSGGQGNGRAVRLGRRQ